MKKGIVCIGGTYQPGDMPPVGYGAWDDWAKAQIKGGLRQARCRATGKYEFPQEHRAHCQKRVEGDE